jgi:hypothetical protein
MNRKSRILGRFSNGGAIDSFYDDGKNSYDFEYPPYLKNEYENNYNCSPKEFSEIVIDEVESCRISITDKNENYKLWFGKFKGELLHEITDKNYLYWLCDTQRKTNPKLVGQALLRIEEL